MRRRPVRITLLVLLLLIGAGAGMVVWSVDGQRQTLTANRDNVTERLDRIVTAINDIGAAQQAYVAPGQSTQAAFEEVAAQIQRIYSELQAVRPALRAIEATELLKVIADGTAALFEADSSAKAHLRSSQALWAAEIVFGQARDTRATMTQAVRALQAAESRVLQTEQDQLARTLWSVLAGAAGLWALGLVALAWTPRSAVTMTTSEQPAPPLAIVAPVVAEDLPPPSAPAVDLAGAAAVCIDISRMTSGDALPGVLARTAAVVDASGIILWLGAGDRLFAAAAHGYDARAIERLGGIARSADNATAAAWRSGEVGFVEGNVSSNGAIVAPMFGPEGCVGILAAEVRHRRETDEATRAVTAMIAAQLAMVLSAARPGSGNSAAEQPGQRAQAASLR
jgi:hypothetical protein